MATHQTHSRPKRKTSVQVGLDAVLVSALVVLAIALFVPSARYEWLAVAPLIGGAVIALFTALARAFL